MRQLKEVRMRIEKRFQEVSETAAAGGRLRCRVG